MRDLIISDCHKNDLKFLQGKSQNIFSDFCKLTSNFIEKGHNMKLYNTVSRNLQIDIKQVQSVVEGLAHLFVEAGKFKLTRTAFEEVILNLGLPVDVLGIIYNEYLLQTKAIGFGLSTIEIQHLQYKNVDWRLDIQMSSKANIHQCKPKIILKFEFEKSRKPINICLKSNISKIIQISCLINIALQDSKTNHSKKIARAIL